MTTPNRSRSPRMFFYDEDGNKLSEWRNGWRGPKGTRGNQEGVAFYVAVQEDGEISVHRPKTVDEIVSEIEIPDYPPEH